MINHLYPILLLLMLSAISFAEAWLEVIVIDLKDPTLVNYSDLNNQEHRRSMVYTSLVALPFLVDAALAGFWWLLLPIVINRRMVFDPALKLLRRPARNLNRYEGTGPIDATMSRIFGYNGARTELGLEICATIVCIVLQYC